MNGYWWAIWIQAPLLLLNQILISIVETKQSKSVEKKTILRIMWLLSNSP